MPRSPKFCIFGADLNLRNQLPSAASLIFILLAWVKRYLASPRTTATARYPLHPDIFRISVSIFTYSMTRHAVGHWCWGCSSPHLDTKTQFSDTLIFITTQHRVSFRVFEGEGLFVILPPFKHAKCNQSWHSKWDCSWRGVGECGVLSFSRGIDNEKRDPLI